MPFVEVRMLDKSAPRLRTQIMTFAEWCQRNSFGATTGWRIMKSGQGPKVTQISARRIGIREDHHAEWLKTRPTRQLGARTSK